MTQFQSPNPSPRPISPTKRLRHFQKARIAPPIMQSDCVTHWTDKLFSSQTNRPPSFRFQFSEFAMIGLTDSNGQVATCAYTIASPHWDDHLELNSIIFPGGPPTMRLWHIQIGNDIILRLKTTYTSDLARLRDGKRSYLLANGAGFAPFASPIR